jgi:hypothetical protein
MSLIVSHDNIISPLGARFVEKILKKSMIDEFSYKI